MASSFSRPLLPSPGVFPVWNTVDPAIQHRARIGFDYYARTPMFYEFRSAATVLRDDKGFAESIPSSVT